MDMSRRTVIAGAAAAGLTAATLGSAHATGSGAAAPVRSLFGVLPDGTKVHSWSLANGGTRMKVLSYGGVVQSLEVPDRRGGSPTYRWASAPSTTTSPPARTSAR